MIFKVKQSDINRFNTKFQVGEVDNCWEWNGGKSKSSGRGRFWIDGNTRNAYVVSWVVNFGDVPDGLQVLHKCDNPSCVNPNHLFLGTQKDNMQDMVRKGRKFLTLGELHGQNKLSVDDVLEIRKRRKSGEHYSSISRDFNLHPNYARDICIYKTWKHLS